MSLISSALTTLKTRGLCTMLSATTNLAVASFERMTGKRFAERKIYDYKMLLDLNDRGISRTLILFGERELEHKAMLEKVLKPGMHILDIGANIGYYALMELGQIGKEGSLIAIEPSPSNVELLKRNLTLNGYEGIEVHNAAVSDEPGTRTFFLSEMSNLNTFHDNGTGQLHLSGKTVDVETVTVPQVIKDRPLDLIRMDVEGHEVEVINGLLPSIENGDMAPMIIFETHLSRYGEEHDIEAPLRRLFAQGYSVKLAGSSSQNGTKIIESKGYKGGKPIKSDDVERVIFENISDEDAIDMICREGGIRTVLVGR